MKKIILFAVTVFLLASCNSAPTARIDVTVNGAADSSVVLQKLLFNKLQAVDTIKTDAQGHFNYKIKLKGNAPYFYYLYFGDSPVASMILLPKDKVQIKASVGGGYEISGSEESSLLQEVNGRFTSLIGSMESLAQEAQSCEDAVRAKEINAELSRLYINYRKEATKYVMNNPYSITSALVLFQKINDDLPVFAASTDALLFQRVKDSLQTVYPASEFMLALSDEATSRINEMELQNRLSSAQTVGFPYLNMPDENGNMKALSDFEGKVVIVSFWSVAQTEHKMFNNDLVEIYEKYHDKGLEIYQVSLDIDKSDWASSVKAQKLPWVNVNDGKGTSSISVGLYNVQKIPSMFVFDREGNLKATDVYEKDALEKAIKACL